MRPLHEARWPMIVRCLKVPAGKAAGEAAAGLSCGGSSLALGALLRCSNSWPARRTRCTRFARATRTAARVRLGGSLRSQATSPALLGAASAPRRAPARGLAGATCGVPGYECRMACRKGLCGLGAARICGAEQRRTLGLRAQRASQSDSRSCPSSTSEASAASSARRPRVRAAQGSRAPRARPPQLSAAPSPHSPLPPQPSPATGSDNPIQPRGAHRLPWPPA